MAGGCCVVVVVGSEEDASFKGLDPAVGWTRDPPHTDASKENDQSQINYLDDDSQLAIQAGNKLTPSFSLPWHH